MKFLIICSPIIKFLLNKYIPNLPHNEEASDLIRKFNAQEILIPDQSSNFIKILSTLQNYLVSNNITYRVDSIRKLIGNGQKWTGLLNLLISQKHEVFLCLYEPSLFKNFLDPFQKIFGTDYSNLRIIAPLDLDETEEIYSTIHNILKLPFYPFLHNVLTSKWLLNFTFAPQTPKTFFFPNGTKALDYLEKIKKIAQKENIKYVILKDEYDSDLRAMVPYSITPIDKLEHYCSIFYEKSQGIPDIGGLLIQEFHENNKIVDVYKSHIYSNIIPKADIHYKSTLKPYDSGSFLDSIIENPTEELATITQQCIDFINPIIHQYYPFVLSSIDFIIQNNHVFVIDVNGVSRTLSNDKDLAILPVDAILNTFINHLSAEKNEDAYNKQLNYQRTMHSLYQEIRNYGPGFTSGDQLIKLTDNSEYSVKKLCLDLATCRKGD